jgi:hypothetical protein
MSWDDCAFGDWEDCKCEDTTDNEWDKYSITHKGSTQSKTRGAGKRFGVVVGSLIMKQSEFKKPYMATGYLNMEYEDPKDYTGRQSRPEKFKEIIPQGSTYDSPGQKPYMEEDDSYMDMMIDQPDIKTEMSSPDDSGEGGLGYIGGGADSPPGGPPGAGGTGGGVGGIGGGGAGGGWGETGYEDWLSLLDDSCWQSRDHYFDDDYWDQENEAGEGSWWESDDSRWKVTPEGDINVGYGTSWATDYRPAALILTWSYNSDVASIGIEIVDTNNDDISSALATQSGVPITINWSSYDLQKLYLTPAGVGAPGTAYFYNIEFVHATSLFNSTYQRWRSVDNILYLGAIGNAFSDFRPSKIRVTFEGPPTINLSLTGVCSPENNTVVLASNATYVSRQELEIDWLASEIAHLEISGASEIDVFDIEFYGGI